MIAVALRGDRGLEQQDCLKLRVKYFYCGRSSGRSRIGTQVDRGGKLSLILRSLFGAIEDWNSSQVKDPATIPKLRSLFGAIEDWNRLGIPIFPRPRLLRSLFGAIEDWNQPSNLGLNEKGIAVALRGDRGLELVRVETFHGLAIDCGRSSGRSRIGTITIAALRLRRRDCGRSSGRSRIGTSRQQGAPITKNCGRSSGRSRIGTLEGIPADDRRN